MSDWIFDRQPPTQASLAERALADSPGPSAAAKPRGGRLIPVLQVSCIIVAIAITTTSSARAGVVAWLLGAIAVPLLWAWFFVEFKRRQVASDSFASEHRRRRANHLLLLVGLAVGMWGAFIFATEVAK